MQKEFSDEFFAFAASIRQIGFLLGGLFEIHAYLRVVGELLSKLGVYCVPPYMTELDLWFCRRRQKQGIM